MISSALIQHLDQEPFGRWWPFRPETEAVESARPFADGLRDYNEGRHFAQHAHQSFV